MDGASLYHPNSSILHLQILEGFVRLGNAFLVSLNEQYTSCGTGPAETMVPLGRYLIYRPSEARFGLFLSRILD
jgi:hypothetical protein